MYLLFSYGLHQARNSKHTLYTEQVFFSIVCIAIRGLLCRKNCKDPFLCVKSVRNILPFETKKTKTKTKQTKKTPKNNSLATMSMCNETTCINTFLNARRKRLGTQLPQILSLKCTLFKKYQMYLFALE